MELLWHSLLHSLKKRQLNRARAILKNELYCQLEELKILGVAVNQVVEKCPAPLETKICQVLSVRSDCIILSGGLRLEMEPSLALLKEGDSVNMKRTSMSSFDTWEFDSVNNMDLILMDCEAAVKRRDVEDVEVIDLSGDTVPEVERIVEGHVTDKDYGRISVEPQGYTINVVDVKCNFTPEIGDAVIMVVKRVDFTDAVVKITPRKTKYFEGKVVDWDGSRGQIKNSDNEATLFYFADCDMNYVPQVGDTVCADTIENRSTSLNWRATKVVMLNLAKSDSLFDLEVDELLQDNKEILIGKHSDCGKFTLGSKGRLMVHITNDSGKDRYLTGVYPCLKVSPDPQFKIATELTFPHRMEHKGELIVCFECCPKLEGAWRDLYVFDFENGVTRLGRFFTVEVGDDSNKRRDFYRKTKKQPNTAFSGPLVRPDRNSDLNPFRRRVKKNNLPENIKKVVLSLADMRKEEILLFMQNNFPCLTEEMSTYNYVQRFKLLLHLEEAESASTLERWNLKDVVLEKNVGQKDCFCVQALQLTERRPSVLSGDSVQVQNCKGGPVYEGVVEETNHGTITFKLNSSFPHAYSAEPCNVNFFVSRTNFKFQHTAIDAAWKTLGDEVLFPTAIEKKEPQCAAEKKLNFSYPADKDGPTTSSATDKKANKSGGWFNPNLNPSQRAAVSNILWGEARPMPYVIFGPPGTGKTMTLVEAILQINKNVPNSRILVSTPSNSAADLITELLCSANTSLKPEVLIRLVAYNYRRTVPGYLQKYSVIVKSDGGNDVITNVGINKITVGTCSSVGRLCLQQKVPFYTHIFIDEAGQASEPETMCAVALLGKPHQIVLAGDPKQLGPVILGKIAIQGGLETSWLARILQCPLYSRQPKNFFSTQGYNPSLITMLTVNYRTVPEILAVPSKLFYNDLLVPMVSQGSGKERDLLNRMADELPLGTNGPAALVFHGIRGQCCREQDSPSWFNPNEATQVFLYVRKLLKKHVKAWDVGIITFYAKQTAKMRELLRSGGIFDVKVGSVEEFQGQERLVMLLSTVRVKTMNDHSLGFMSNPNRINVALTRAKALLIIVGDPHLLIQDRNWKTVIMDCVQRRAYVGCDLPFSSANQQSHNLRVEPNW